MRKKFYNIPTTETLPLEAFGSIMITSVKDTFGGLPKEPAPRRKTEVF